MLVAASDPKTGEIVCHDIYVAGQWAGSRSTPRQAIERLRWLGWSSAVIGVNQSSGSELTPSRLSV